MIEIEGVSKSYGETRAVDCLDLKIPRNSLFGLIGPNGAGKTTTLKMLATLIKPDNGRVSIDGLDLRDDVREIRRRIGYMPDNFGTFRNLNCEEYLYFFGRCYGLSGSTLDKRVEDVLLLTDLRPMREQLTAALSTGLRQRLCLAKTLIHDPDLLILDEPASGLDPRARIEIRVLLKELATMGKTIIISSHILADLEEICSEMAIIEHGKLTWSGSIESIGELTQTIDVEEFTVEVNAEDVEKAKTILRALPTVVDLSVDRARLQVKARDGKKNDLLDALLAADIEVLHFSFKRASLESFFLSSTKGIDA